MLSQVTQNEIQSKTKKLPATYETLILTSPTQSLVGGFL